MLIFIIFLFLTIIPCIIISKNNVKISVKVAMAIFINVILILSILFKHYLENELWIVGTIIPFLLLVTNILCAILLLFKYKAKTFFANIIVTVIAIIFLYNNVDENISLRIELHHFRHSTKIGGFV